MRCAALAAVLGSSLAFGSACATSNVGADAGAVDAASGPQPIGTPCDPSLATPCLPTGDPCLGVQCEGSAAGFVCTAYATDASPSCTGGGATCTGDADCETGLTCGFPIAGGCSAQGFCINPPLACEDDAAACGGAGTVCGCSGLPVPVLLPGYAGAPTPSNGECGGGDAGLFPSDGAVGDASDAGNSD